MKTEGSGVIRLAMAFVLGLGGALAWRDSTLAKSRVGIFFFLPSPCSQRCTGSSRPASEMNMGTSWKPQPPGWGLRRIRSAEGVGGLRTSAWGLCKNKELKKYIYQRGEATQSRREDRRLWDVVQGPRSGFGGEKKFFSSLNGNRDGVELFHWWG